MHLKKEFIKSNILLFFITILSVKNTLSEQLECDYIRHSDGYNCEMMNTFEEPKEISSVVGAHKAGMDNTKVEVFFIIDTSKTKYVPSKVCSVFPNINKIDIYGTNVLQLKRNIFEGCTNVKKIVIKYVSFKTLEEDIFHEATNLEYFVLGFTSVETLPMKLFEKNKNLKFVDLSYNKLKSIKTQFPDNLTMLSLMNNICIDAYYDYRINVNEKTQMSFLQEMYEKCNPDNMNTTRAPETYHNTQLRMIEEKISDNNNLLLLLESNIDELDMKLNEEIEKNRINFKVYKEDTEENLKFIKKNIEKLENDVKEQADNFFKISNEISDDSRSSKTKLEENNKFKEVSDDIQAQIVNNERILLALFFCQLAMITAATLFATYKYFYRR